ncbi:MAG: M28 family metallopeptidase [Acidobacteriales bacterium]|nr:M28 family metallopeptidase [Terriglobales bacterium]
MTRHLLVSSLLCLGVFPVSSMAQGQPPIKGYSAKSSQAQIKVESDFRSRISPERAREWHRYFTAEPHPAGSERNNHLAEYIAEKWREQGMEDVTIRRYDVLNSFPKEVVVEMTAPVAYRASLKEDAYDVDPDTSNPKVDKAYSGLSASGEVTAPIVYAHSGNPEDYEVLRRQGIDVRGKIVLVRYSNPYSYRGFKALTAQRLGVAALLIYSDPAEDGYKKGKVFPDGPYGPESHLQRGAITYDFMVPGDPLTPGWASRPGARRIPPEEAISLPHIIAVPLSWHDAKPLLEHMGGPEAPKDWQGGLPITYRMGGAGTAHVKVEMDNRVAPNYVVEARIRGSEAPEDWIILGNHRDAWVFGGVDPSSGTASMMELTRALGDMLRQGIRPRRTLIVCSWDGEEVGLTGSTEWGEDFADDLKKHAVAYLNVDSSTSGPVFEPASVASLAPLLIEVARSLPEPRGGTLFDHWKKDTAQTRAKSKDKRPVTDADLVDTRIGSGSDHTVFLNRLGIPTLLLQFNGPYGVYHSMYDDFYWMNHIGDPGYKYHTLMAQLWGVLALRLANADVLPFDFALAARHLRGFVREVQAKPGVAKNVDLKPLLAAVARFEAAGVAVNRLIATDAAGSKKDATLNATLRGMEQTWLYEKGIPGRPWFQHLLYAARYTYAHLELPGLTEAVEKQDWVESQRQADLLVAATRRAAESLEKMVPPEVKKPGQSRAH